MSLDAYFYMDMNQPEDTRRMEVFCVECFEKSGLEGGMFWQGSIRGYGEYEVACGKCSQKIHVVENESNVGKSQ